MHCEHKKVENHCRWSLRPHCCNNRARFRAIAMYTFVFAEAHSVPSVQKNSCNLGTLINKSHTPENDSKQGDKRLISVHDIYVYIVN